MADIKAAVGLCTGRPGAGTWTDLQMYEAVRDLRTADITTAAEGDGIQIQTCISAAAGDCDIEL